MTIDSTLASASVAGLAWDLSGVLAGSIEGATLPTYGQTIGGASVQVADEPAAGAMLANFRSGSPLSVSIVDGTPSS